MKNILDVTCIYNVQTFSLKLGAKNWGKKYLQKIWFPNSNHTTGQQK